MSCCIIGRTQLAIMNTVVLASLISILSIYLLLPRQAAGVCVDVDLQLVRRPRTVFNNEAVLRLSGDFPLTMNTSLLRLFFSPPLSLNIDYTIEPVNLYRLPPPYQKETRVNSFRLKLLPGRTWIPELSSISATNFDAPPEKQLHTLVLTQSKYCGTVGRPIVRSASAVTFAHVQTSPDHPCPTGLEKLPRVSPEFQAYLTDILRFCQHPRILSLSQLHANRINSISLLYLQPPVLLVDARSATLPRASSAIDAFLASHSVLEVVWEPLEESEPRWWVLMPGPLGLPGHIFAMIDRLQWQHPKVTDAASRFKANFNCTMDRAGCTPGCPGTKLVVTWCSGWGADTHRMATELLRSLVDNEPLQIGPVRYPERVSFPAWNDKVGWSYTFGACDSNFLDCFFLDHSPCPPIRADVWNDPGQININQSSPRFKSSRPENDNFDTKPVWWKQIAGPPTNQPSSHQDLRGSVVNHILYSYFFRPKYDLRRRIQLAVHEFGLKQDSCAFVHVRRGDVLLHGVHSR